MVSKYSSDDVNVGLDVTVLKYIFHIVLRVTFLLVATCQVLFFFSFLLVGDLPHGRFLGKKVEFLTLFDWCLGGGQTVGIKRNGGVLSSRRLLCITNTKGSAKWWGP